MEADQPQDFNDRLSQWIASQGFWFQLRYSMSGGGGWSLALFHLFRISVRLLILLLIVAVGFAFYLKSQAKSDEFRSEMGDKFAQAMSASDAEISGFEWAGGEGRIKRFGAKGTPTSFFETLEAGNVTYKMGFLDRFTDQHDAGVIRGNWIDVHVKAGGDSPEEGSAAAETLFKQRDGFLVSGASFSRARVQWGFNETQLGRFDGRSRMGLIEGSGMVASRINEGWHFSFNGGTFSQNWIRKIEIEELEMLCTPEALIIEKGRFRAGDGTVEFKEVRIEGGVMPRISGRMILNRVPLERLTPEKVAERMTGSISGELEFSGSTNSTEGILMEGTIMLGEGDRIVLEKDSFPIIEALDVVDVYNSYKRLSFDQGNFRLKTGAGEMTVTDLSLVSPEGFTLEGSMKVRLPTAEEAAEQIGEASSNLMETLSEDPEEQKRKDITLKRAAEALKKEIDFDEAEESGEESEASKLFAEFAMRRDAETLEREAAQRALAALIFDGSLRISIPPDAFERSQILQQRYPVDDVTGRISLLVPLEGSLSELTLKQAQRLLEDGKSDE